MRFKKICICIAAIFLAGLAFPAGMIRAEAPLTAISNKYAEIKSSKFLAKDEMSRTLYFKGISDAGAGLWKDARESFMAAISLEPEFAEAYFALGTASLKIGLYEEACESFEKVLLYLIDLNCGLDDKKPLDKALISLISVETEDALKQSTLLNPCRFEIEASRAACYVILERYDEAIEKYSDLHEKYKDYKESLLFKAFSYKMKKNFNDSTKHFSEYIKTDPENIEARCLIIIDFLNLKNSGRAAEELKMLEKFDRTKAKEYEKLFFNRH